MPAASEVYGVFEGGGVQAIALVGAVAASEERGISFRAVAGASAGAIVAALLAAGYNAREMQALLLDTDFGRFKDPICRIPFWNRIRASYWDLGLYRGDEFHRWISEKLRRRATGSTRSDLRFKDLPKPLSVVAADVIRQEVKVFSSRLTPDMVVADAVRMSMSIPLFFIPVRLGSELIVEGGVWTNFPVWAFQDEQKELPLPILEFRLEANTVASAKVSTGSELTEALAHTVIRGSVQSQVHIADLLGLNIIELPTLRVRPTDFNIRKGRKDELFVAGYDRAKSRLATQRLIAPLSAEARLERFAAPTKDADSKVLREVAKIAKQVSSIEKASIPQEEASVPQTVRDKVFISYSHKDQSWLEKLLTHLKPLVRKGVNLWVDTQIKEGDEWRAEIQRGVAAAKVAVLLVSPDFLDSDFIAEHELPPLLKSAEEQGLRILWVPISASSYLETEVAKYQAAHDPSQPLDTLDIPQQNQALVRICEKIKEAFSA